MHAHTDTHAYTILFSLIFSYILSTHFLAVFIFVPKSLFFLTFMQGLFFCSHKTSTLLAFTFLTLHGVYFSFLFYTHNFWELGCSYYPPCILQAGLFTGLVFSIFLTFSTPIMYPLLPAPSRNSICWARCVTRMHAPPRGMLHKSCCAVDCFVMYFVHRRASQIVVCC